MNALELAVETTPEKWDPEANPPVPEWGSTIYISREAAEESIQKKVVLYDRDGDYHYDIISAFIKSLRGRDPDAASYWLARMVKAGEDPHFIFRRMLISACEDTGLADPHAITVVESCAAAFDRVGLPEGRYFLAHAALYLSTAPKSNSSMAFFDALASVEKEDADVPNHLKDSSRDAEGFGHGSGYLYPHAYRDHWVAQQYLPDSLVGKVFYTPSTQGYEATIRDEVLSRREIQIASLVEKDYESNGSEAPSMENPISDWWIQEHFRSGDSKKEENLTFTPEDKNKSSVLDRAERSWRARLDLNRAQILTQIRDTMAGLADLKRHHRSLIWNADDCLLIFDLMRKCPEGLVCGVCRNSQGKELLEQYASMLGNMDRPLLSVQSGKPVFSPANIRSCVEAMGDIVLDRIFFRDMFSSLSDINQAAASIRELFTGTESETRDIAYDPESVPQKDRPPLLEKRAKIIFSQRIPSMGQHISPLISQQIFASQKMDAETSRILIDMEKAEKAFFSDKNNRLFAWGPGDVEKIFSAQGFSVRTQRTALVEKRRIVAGEIEKWFDTENSSYGKAMCGTIGKESCEKIKSILKAAAEKQIFTWKTENAFFTCGFGD